MTSLYDCSLYDRSLYDCSLYDRSLYDCSLYDRSLYDCGHTDCGHTDCSLYDRSLYDCSLYDRSLYDCGHTDCGHTDCSLYDRSLYDCSLYDRSLYDCSLYDRSLYDRSLYDRSLYDRSLYDRSLYDRSLYDRSLYDRSLITEEAELLKFLNFSKTLFDRVDTVPVEPHQPQPTTPAPEPGPTAAETETELQTTDRAPREPTTREEEEVVDASPTVDSARRTSAETPTSTLGNSLDLDQNQDQDWLEPAVSDTELHNEIVPADPRGRMYELDAPKEVTSENLWERTDVLAAIIACGVVGFLCAVFLLLLLAYRMKKKDEGSYDLGETKLTNTAYHKAPTKEFYA
uniref:Syndecan n=1 Tax=Knipowitschia caucasica TaxID=637954 RepID=A0AAV2MFL1_KNICA